MSEFQPSTIEITELDQAVDVDRPRDVYFRRSREPLVALIFIAPMLLCYELGVLVFGQMQIQNGIDACLRSTLSNFGFSQYFLLPLLAVFLLAGWHHTLDRPWRLPGPRLFSTMATECLLLATIPWILWNVLLVVAPFDTGPTAEVGPSDGGSYSIGYDQAASYDYVDQAKPDDFPAGAYDRHGPVGSIAGGGDPLLGRIGRAVGFFGAGVYEELFFRLILLSLILWALLSLGVQRTQAVIGAVLLSSLLFSIAHYIGPVGDVFDPTTFTFRLMTGAFFAMLFLRRGFGIAAGSHAAYNILVGTILR